MITSKIIHKEVVLSRPHNFQAVVFPWPITVSEHKGPFCTKIYIVKIQPDADWTGALHKVKRDNTLSRDAQGPIIP